jgi:PleD family two-component response regulator
VANETAGDGDEILVLHVDDEPQFCELVASRLEGLDEQVTVVTETEPSAGLDRLTEEPVDCVVSDYQMPRMDGLECWTPFGRSTRTSRSSSSPVTGARTSRRRPSTRT